MKRAMEYKNKIQYVCGKPTNYPGIATASDRRGTTSKVDVLHLKSKARSDIGCLTCAVFDWQRTRRGGGLAATPGHMDGFVIHHPYKCHLEEVASVGDLLKIWPELDSRRGTGQAAGARPRNPAPPYPAVRVSGFGFRVSGFGFRVSGFGFRVSGFGFRDPLIDFI